MMEMSLSGKTIVITRDVNQGKPFAEKLEDLGATVLSFPTIKITEPDNPGRIREMLRDATAFDWIIFTSSNAVRYFLKFINNIQSTLEGINISCVGKKTAETLEKSNITPTLIPNIFTSDELLTALLKYDVRGKRILLPVSNLAGKELQEGLIERGAQVERVEVYKTVPFKNAPKEMMLKKIDKNEIDCITFFSPSAIDTFAHLMEKRGMRKIINKNIPIAVIGPTTARAARENNLNPEIIPEKSDEKSFLEEMVKYFRVVG